MQQLLVAIFATVFAVKAQDTCPVFGEWMEKTSCLWLHPLTEMRQNMTNACDLNFDISQLPTAPPLPEDLRSQIPGKCGYCSFKFQCRKRDAADSCFPIEGRTETCSQYSGVCDMPKTPHFNDCKWGIFLEMLKQCINRPDIPEWKRDEFRKFGQMAPEANCAEVGGRCKCCCHPYKPTINGSTCQKLSAPQCSPYESWNDWSECLWFPLKNLAAKFQQHCSINYKPPGGAAPKVPLPEGFQIPNKCGYCSFKVRCRKRDRKDANGKPRCFPIDADKKACGPEDCETCGNICTLPKLAGNCNWSRHIRTALKSKLAKVDKLPYWRRRGMTNIVKNLPIGKCVEKDNQCKCCCHPYEPNEDGTGCQLKGYCQLPQDLGINLFSENFFFK